jgi:hypothetical protein
MILQVAVNTFQSVNKCAFQFKVNNFKFLQLEHEVGPNQ